jgi:hypothetical protein
MLFWMRQILYVFFICVKIIPLFKFELKKLIHDIILCLTNIIFNDAFILLTTAYTPQPRGRIIKAFLIDLCRIIAPGLIGIIRSIQRPAGSSWGYHNTIIIRSHTDYMLFTAYSWKFIANSHIII